MTVEELLVGLFGDNVYEINGMIQIIGSENILKSVVVIDICEEGTIATLPVLEVDIEDEPVILRSIV